MLSLPNTTPGHIKLLPEAFPFPAGLSKYLHNAIEARLEAAQILLFHFNLLQDLLLDGLAFLVPLCQSRGGNWVSSIQHSATACQGQLGSSASAFLT